VLGTFLQFTLLYNEGGAMGTRLGPSTYYLIMALLVLPFLLIYIFRNRGRLIISLPLAFIAGGAVGNLIDRIRYGQVVDFIDVDFFDINIGSFHMERFWTFNVADAAISCAIVFLLIQIILMRKTLDPEPPSPSAQSKDGHEDASHGSV
jgi:signal peptidase II